MKCPYCGSEKIEIGVAWGKSSEMGNVGLNRSQSLSFQSFSYKHQGTHRHPSNP